MYNTEGPDQVESAGGEACRDARTESVAVRFTKQEVELLKSAAGREGQHLREWIRNATLGSAQKQQDDFLLLTELVGQHMLLQSSLRFIANVLGMPVAQFDARLLAISEQKHVEAKSMSEKRQNGGVRFLSAH